MTSKVKLKSLLKFTHLLIKKGKKARASFFVLKTLFSLKKKTKKNPINILHSSIKILTPGVSTRKTVVAGRLYHLPCAINDNKSLYFGCNWLQQSAITSKENKKNLDLSEKLSLECSKTLKKKGNAILMLKQHNKIVSENRPFLRFVRRKRRLRLPRKIYLKRKKFLAFKRNKRNYKQYTKPDEYFDFTLSDRLKYKKIHLADTKIETKFQNVLDKRFLRIDQKRDFVSRLRLMKKKLLNNGGVKFKKTFKRHKIKTFNKKNKI